MERKIITVTELNSFIKLLFDQDEFLMHITVSGEISNCRGVNNSGHIYFSLKEGDCAVKAVMFHSNLSKLRFIPENGMRVLVTGRVSVYQRDGTYQIYVETMEPDGIGALYIAYEQLKAKLEKEGLFNTSRKKSLPKVPLRIGVITSPTGAAVRDIINILGRRFPLARVTLYPALVQGESAAPDLICGLNYFNEKDNADVLIIGRGGGSIEDLWAFNDENLARTVAASHIPVISAVGHETDFTLCDFAADCRAPTPSAAAELAVPDSAELLRKYGNVCTHLELSLHKYIDVARERLTRSSTARVLQSPQVYFDDKRMALGMEERALFDKTANLLARKRMAFARVDHALPTLMSPLLTRKRAALSSSAARLDGLSPLSAIARGYSAVYKENRALVRSVTQVSPGENVSFLLTDGVVRASVTESKKK